MTSRGATSMASKSHSVVCERADLSAISMCFDFLLSRVLILSNEIDKMNPHISSAVRWIKLVLEPEGLNKHESNS